MLPYKMYYTEGTINFMGWLGLISLVGIWVTSLPMFRQKFSYESFRIFHWMFSALFLLGSNLHDYNMCFFVQPAMIMMVTDYCLCRNSFLTFSSLEETSACSSHMLQHKGMVHCFSSTVSGSTMACFTFSIPESWSVLQPGMHVLLTIPRMSRWQPHPFSISQVNEERRTFTIHIKARGNWTKDVVASSSRHDHLWNDCSVEGQCSIPFKDTNIAFSSQVV